MYHQKIIIKNNNIKNTSDKKVYELVDKLTMFSKDNINIYKSTPLIHECFTMESNRGKIY